jgi:predicted DNA-binding transcriptional regulator YafY
MRSSRLLSIQMLLQTRGRMSAPALAAALEVSVRTLYRDVDQLSAAGVPIYAERGRAGGFELMAGWQTTLTGLTPAEAQAVFLGGLPGPAAQLGLGREVESARLKLLTALPAAWRSDAQRISSRLHLDPLDWYRDSEAVPQLAAVAEAVWGQRPLAMRYQSWKGASRRTVDALGLVLKAGAWYLVAAVEGEPRTFRVSNISHAAVLPARARTPRKTFDLAAYWRESMRRFERELYRGEATVLASVAGVAQLRCLSSAVAQAVAAATPSRRDDGRTRLRIPIESIPQATAQLLRLAPAVEVIEPKALRASIVERVRQIGRLYGVAAASRLNRPSRQTP